MKNLNRIAWPGLLFLSALALGACDSDNESEEAASSDSDMPKRYQVRQGMIEYAVSGMQSGTETLYWRDWGREEAKYTNTSLSMMGMTQTTKTWTITTPDTIIAIDQVANTATSMVNPAKAMMENMTEEQLVDMGEQMMQQMGGRQEGTDNVAGQDCDVWKIPMGNAQTCLWNGLTLSNTADMGGMSMSTMATTIDTSASVSDEHFTVPEGINVTDIGSIPGLGGFTGIPGMADNPQ